MQVDSAVADLDASPSQCARVLVGDGALVCVRTGEDHEGVVVALHLRDGTRDAEAVVASTDGLLGVFAGTAALSAQIDVIHPPP